MNNQLQEGPMEIYKEQKVVGEFHSQELPTEDKTHAIVSKCRKSVKKDMEIMESWKGYFKTKEIPFVITIKRNIMSIWIEQEVFSRPTDYYLKSLL